MTNLNSFNFITNRLAIGDVFSRSEKGWSAIVSVISDEELKSFQDFSDKYNDRFIVTEEGVPVFRINVWDGGGGITKYLDDVIKFIGEHIKNGCVLIHCAAGMSRSVSIAIAYLCTTIGMDISEAESFIRERREQAFPADIFKVEIYKWLKMDKLLSSGPRCEKTSYKRLSFLDDYEKE